MNRKHRRVIPGTPIFDGVSAQKGYALNKMCFSFNDAANRAEFARDEDAYCAKFGLTQEQREAVQAPQRARADRGRRQHLLPRQACRHFRPQRAGSRRAADRHDGRGLQSETSRGGENDMARVDRRHRHLPYPLHRQRHRQGALQTIPIGSRSSTASTRARAMAGRGEAGCRVVIFYNDHGLNFFLDKLPTFAIGAAPEYRQRRRGLGHADPAPVPRRSRSVLAPDRMRSSPTNSTSPSARRCWSITPSPCRWRCCGRATTTGRCAIVPVAINTVQHPLPSPSRCFRLGQSIGRAIESYRPGCARVGARHRRPVASARRHAGRLHQHRVRPDVPRQDRARAGGADRVIPRSIWSRSPARRGSSSSTGSPCAAR